MSQLREWIEEESGNSLQQAGELKMRSSTRNQDHLLPILRYGRHGEIGPEELEKAAKEAQSQKLTLRLTPHQELWAFDPEALKQISTIQNSPSSIFHPPSSIPPTGRITACAGERYCPLSLWDIKQDTEKLPLSILTEHGLSVGFSGCLKGCGRHHHHDLGLVGLRSNAYGPTERALRIFIGAVQSPRPAPARLLFYAVPERSVAPLFEVIVEDFRRSALPDFESFSREVLWRYSSETLMIWYLLRVTGAIPPPLSMRFGSLGDAELRAELSALPELHDLPAETSDLISTLSHRLWDRDRRSSESAG
jgi:ferredoxin-nitrite reductase